MNGDNVEKFEVVVPVPPQNTEIRIHNIHTRMLEGYHCWLKHTGTKRVRDIPANGHEKKAAELREILVWKVLWSVSEFTCFAPERMAQIFHHMKGNGSRDQPWGVNIALLHKGLHQMSEGKVNLDDINSNTLTADQVAAYSGGHSEPTVATLFDVDCYFRWEGKTIPSTKYLAKHVDTQNRNITKLLLGHAQPEDLKSLVVEAERNASDLDGAPAKMEIFQGPAEKKYFNEPQKSWVVLVALRNYAPLLYVKVWFFVIALMLRGHWNGDRFWQAIAQGDGVVYFITGLLEIILRFVLYGRNWARSRPYGYVATIVVGFLGIIQWGFATAMVASITGVLDAFADQGFGSPITVIWPSWHLTIYLFYIALRLVCFIVINLWLWLSFTPTIQGKFNTKSWSFFASLKRKFRWRVLVTLLFWIAIWATVVAFEYGFLTEIVVDLYPSQVCNCVFDGMQCLRQKNLICTITVVVVWMLAVVTFLIDSHIIFVAYLALLGALVGIKTQLGTYRAAQLKINPAEIVRRISHRILIETTEAQQEEKAISIWNAIIDDLYHNDLITRFQRAALHIKHCTDEEWEIELPVQEAQERLSFFVNSLFMKRIPPPTSFAAIQPMTVIIPSFDETVVFTPVELIQHQYTGGDRIPSNIEYLISCYPLQWENFTARIMGASYGSLRLLKEFRNGRLEPGVVKEICFWASFRAQTVARTIRGTNYYYKALQLLGAEDRLIKERFQLILALQTFATNVNAEKRAAVQLLLERFPNVELTYHYEKNDNPHPTQLPIKQALEAIDPSIKYCTCKGVYKNGNIELVDILPRSWPFVVGTRNAKTQGKALNQKNGIMFAWGEIIQTLDANQDGSLEDAMKLPELMQLFHAKNDDPIPRYRIIGFRETIYTEDLSLVGKFMGVADFSFTSIVGRVLASPLSVRMHYGHPDLFDGMWVFSRGALNKASAIINLNEDIYAGYTATLRNQRITHKEYIQMRKGRETALPLADKFESKLAEGGASQLRSSDLWELNQRLNFFKMASLFYASVGFYITQSILVFSIYLYVAVPLLLALANTRPDQLENVGSAFSYEWILSIGLIYMIPAVVEILVEHGIRRIFDLIATMAPAILFFTFLLRTKAANFNNAIISGQAAYRATGRKLNIERDNLKAAYLRWINTHFLGGLKLLTMIFVYFAIAMNFHLPMIWPCIVGFIWVLFPMLVNPFPSIAAVNAEAKQIWTWLGRSHNIDLCAIVFSHRNDPVPHKDLPTRANVEEDSWSDWYLLDQAFLLHQRYQGVTGKLFQVAVHIIWLIIFILIVLGMDPNVFLAIIYTLCLCLIFFGIYTLRMLVQRALSIDSSIILSIAFIIVIVIGFVVLFAANPIDATQSIGFREVLIAIIIVLCLTRIVRDFVYLVLGLFCLNRMRDQSLLTIMHFIEHTSLQRSLLWLGSGCIIVGQLILGYALSLISSLHTTLLYNSNLTKKNHGLNPPLPGNIFKLTSAMTEDNKDKKDKDKKDKGKDKDKDKKEKKEKDKKEKDKKEKEKEDKKEKGKTK